MTFATIQRGRDNIPRFSSHGKFDSVAICYPTGVFKGPKTTVEPEVTVRKSLAERVHSLVVQGGDRSILCRAQPLRMYLTGVNDEPPASCIYQFPHIVKEELPAVLIVDTDSGLDRERQRQRLGLSHHSSDHINGDTLVLHQCSTKLPSPSNAVGRASSIEIDSVKPVLVGEAGGEDSLRRDIAPNLADDGALHLVHC